MGQGYWLATPAMSNPSQFLLLILWIPLCNCQLLIFHSGMEELIMVLTSNQFTNLVLISTQLLTSKLSYRLGIRLTNILLLFLQLILFSIFCAFNLYSIISLFFLLTLPIPSFFFSFILFLPLPPSSLFSSTATSQGPVPSQTLAL